VADPAKLGRFWNWLTDLWFGIGCYRLAGLDRLQLHQQHKEATTLKV
jgi:hypothetical protein